MKPLLKYLEHCAGFYSLLAWLEEEKKEGFSYQLSNQIIELDTLRSRYFSLGIKKGTKEVFLAIQPSESDWFRLIKWNKVIIKNNRNKIYFLADVVDGDQQENPDMPPFAISLTIDSIDKIMILQSIKNLVGREYFQDDTGTIHVNFHKKLFTIPIEIYESNTPIVPTVNIYSHSEIISSKESGLQFSAPPEFLGDINEAKSLTDKWNSKEKLLRKNAEKLK